MESSRLPAGLPTPGLGIFERINVLGFMFWLAVLSITVLREQAGMPKTRPAA